jgi:hypothetical protein
MIITSQSSKSIMKRLSFGRSAALQKSSMACHLRLESLLLLLLVVVSTTTAHATSFVGFPGTTSGTRSGFDMGGNDPVCWQAPAISTTTNSPTTKTTSITDDILVLRPLPFPTSQPQEEEEQQQQQTLRTTQPQPDWQLDRDSIQLLRSCPNGTSLDVIVDPEVHARLKRQPKGWLLYWDESFQVTVGVHLDVTQYGGQLGADEDNSGETGGKSSLHTTNTTTALPTELWIVVSLCQVGFGGGAGCSPFVSQTRATLQKNDEGEPKGIGIGSLEQWQQEVQDASEILSRLPSTATALVRVRLEDMQRTGRSTYEHFTLLQVQGIASGTYTILGSMIFEQMTTTTTNSSNTNENSTSLLQTNSTSTTTAEILKGTGDASSSSHTTSSTTSSTTTTTTVVTVVSNIPSNRDDLLVTVLEKLEPRGVTRGARLTVVVLSSVGGAILTWLLYQTIRHRESQVFKLTQGNFLVAMLTAALIATVSCFTFEPANRMFCRLPGPLIVLPIHVMFSILLGRLWRIRAVISPLLLLTLEKKEHWTNQWVKLLYRWTSRKTPQKRIRIVISEGQLARVICLFVLPQLLCQVLILSRLKNDDVIVPDSNGGGTLSCRYSYFNSNLELSSLVVLLILFVIMVILARTSKDMPSLFNETQAFMDVAVLSFLIFAISGIVLLSTLDDEVSPNISYLVRSLASVSMAVNTSVKILLPKLLVVWRGDIIVVTKLIADHHKTRKPGPHTITLEEPAIPNRRLSLVQMITRKGSGIGLGRRAAAANNAENEAGGHQSQSPGGVTSPATVLNAAGLDRISSLKDSELETGADFQRDDSSDTSSVILFQDGHESKNPSSPHHSGANINDQQPEDMESTPGGGPLARMRQSLFLASGNNLHASAISRETTSSFFGESRDGDYEMTMKGGLDEEGDPENGEVKDSIHYTNLQASMSTLGADFSVSTLPPGAKAYARRNSYRDHFRKNATNKNNPMGVSDHSKYSTGYSVAGNSIVSRSNARPRRASLVQRNVVGGGEKKEKSKATSPFGMSSTLGMLGRSFLGMNKSGHKSADMSFEIGYNPRRRSGETITISETSAPGRRLLLRMIDTQRTLTKLNTAILSGLSVDAADWTEMKERAVALGDAFANEVRFDWEENQKSLKADGSPGDARAPPRRPPTVLRDPKLPREPPKLKRKKKNRSLSAGTLTAFEEEEDDLQDSDLYASISSLPLPSGKSRSSRGQLVSSLSTRSLKDVSSKSLHLGSSKTLKNSLHSVDSKVQNGQGSHGGIMKVPVSPAGKSPNPIVDLNLPPKLPSRLVFGSSFDDQIISHDLPSDSKQTMARSFHGVSNIDDHPTTLKSRSFHGMSNVFPDVRADLPESIHVAERRKSLGFSSDDSLSLDDL